MKKAVLHGKGDVRVEEVEEPKPESGEAKVKVKYCGICGSDLHEFLHGPFPETPFGHEVCGEIVEVGSQVAGLKEGDHVLAFFKGGYGQYMAAPEEFLLKLPEGMNWERAVVFEPLAVAAYGVEKGGVKPEDKVLIAGAGPVGLMSILAVKMLGVETVYVTEISESRRNMAGDLGATAVFNPQELKIPPKIRELTGNEGVDVSIEAVGVESALKDCLASTRFNGKVIVQGIFTDRVPVHMLGFVTKEMTMIGANSLNPPRALEWAMTGKIEPEKMVTSIIPLDQIVTRGLEVLIREKDRDIKILVEP